MNLYIVELVRIDGGAKPVLVHAATAAAAKRKAIAEAKRSTRKDGWSCRGWCRVIYR